MPGREFLLSGLHLRVSEFLQRQHWPDHIVSVLSFANVATFGQHLDVVGIAHTKLAREFVDLFANIFVGDDDIGLAQ